MSVFLLFSMYTLPVIYSVTNFTLAHLYTNLSIDLLKKKTCSFVEINRRCLSLFFFSSRYSVINWRKVNSFNS